MGKREFAGAFDVFGFTDATSNAILTPAASISASDRARLAVDRVAGD
jgi:hypothetical protein